MQLTSKEIENIKDSDFLVSKVKIITDIESLLSETKTKLNDFLSSNSDFRNIKQHSINGKISKGENYKNLPFVILDLPNFFEKQNVFAYRTMLRVKI